MIEFGVPGAIYLTHATCADRRKDFIGPEAIACGERHKNDSAI